MESGGVSAWWGHPATIPVSEPVEGDPAMCGRIARERAAYAELFGFAEVSETAIIPRFTIGPMQLDMVIRTDDDRRQLVPSWWGLVPVWAKDRRMGSKLFNAPAETLLETPAFRPLITRHRCVIPASGFYEWQRQGTTKQPLYIHRRDGQPLALAGLWTTWTDPTSGEQVTSHTIITTESNLFMLPIHDRMPVVLDGAGVDAWLDPALESPVQALAVLRPCSDDALTARAVAPLVKSIRNEG